MKDEDNEICKCDHPRSRRYGVRDRLVCRERYCPCSDFTLYRTIEGYEEKMKTVVKGD